MADVGTKYTEKQVKKLEKQIDEVYGEAKRDIERKIDEFNRKFKIKNDIHKQDVASGKWTQEEYDKWLAGQTFQGRQWEAKRDQIIHTMSNANETAVKMLAGPQSKVFAYNANYEAYTLEHDAGVNFGFGLYDSTTVTRLMKDNPQMLPKWKIDEPKDYTWNQKVVNNAIRQGIIQGERPDQIAKRMADGLVSKNENKMKTFARTAMTGAQNAGRYQRQMEAKNLGINLLKMWMATLDKRTRDSHRHMDGETQKVGDTWHPMKFSNGCRYPGDPEGPAKEVFNCRCTLANDVTDYPSEYERRDQIDGVPIKNMTYDEWYKAKGYDTPKPKKESAKLKKAQALVNKLEQEVKDKGADKKFDNIWYNQSVGYDAYEDKKDSIQSKAEYYEQQINKYTAEGNTDMVDKMQAKLEELKEFEKNGPEYSKLLQDLKDAKQEVITLTPKPDAKTIFGADAYTQDRKNAALWAQTEKEADRALRPNAERAWQGASKDERHAAWDYTAGSGKFNRPLRGYDGSWYSFKGIGKVPLDSEGAEKEIIDLTKMMERSTLDQDTWLRRGVETVEGLSNFVQVPENVLRNASQEELEQLLLGKEVSDQAFMSCGSSKRAGFSRSTMYIYCPKGTQALYCEPFSQYGCGMKKHWDGKAGQDYFGSELETLLQRNTKFRITRVQKRGYQVDLDIEVIDQRPWEIKYN